jgi:hypothetical protein
MYQEVDIRYIVTRSKARSSIYDNVYCQRGRWKSEPARGRHIGAQVRLTQLSNCDRLDLGNNHFIYQFC